MGFFGSKKSSVPEEEGATTASNGSVQSTTGASRATAAGSRGRVGIDHAITLMRSLPTEKNPALVVSVLKTTLESLNIHVADIISDAATREDEIDTRTSQLRGEIESFEQEIAKRADEIQRLDAARAETSRVKAYLEVDEPVAGDHL